MNQKYRREILQILRNGDRARGVHLNDLSGIVGATPETIRQLLAEMEKNGDLKDVRYSPADILQNGESSKAPTSGNQFASFDHMSNPTIYFTLLNNPQGAKMNLGDSYYQHHGIQNPHGDIGNVNFGQMWIGIQSSIDIDALAKELELLRQEMRRRATTLDHDKSLGQIADAESAARKRTVPRLWRSLNPRDCGLLASHARSG